MFHVKITKPLVKQAVFKINATFEKKMDKVTAILYDKLLREIAKKANNGWHTSHISIQAQELGFHSENQVNSAINLFQEDGLIDFIKHPSVPQHNFGIYGITGKGLKFINYEGGYTEKRRYEKYDKVNKRFTWIRHWVWFYTAVISLICNAFFILNHIYKWL